MREILFRGQTRKYGEKVRMGDGQKLPGHWVYGGVLQGAGSHSIIYGGENVNDPGENLDKWCVHTDTLGQFTGLTDKNGKKIFEGDICRFREWSKGEMCWVGKVHWEHQQFMISGGKNKECETMFELCMSRFIPKNIEVIGNIHDNPELL